jgi:hypothetical protein
MVLSVAHKRNGIVGEIKQIKIDIDYFNELHADEAPVQMSFNFENDLADAGLLDPASSGQEWPGQALLPTPRNPDNRPAPAPADVR